MTPNIKGTDSSVFSMYTKKHTFYHIWFYIFQMLFIALENNPYI